MKRPARAMYTIAQYPHPRLWNLDLWCVLNGRGQIMGSMPTLGSAARLVLILSGETVSSSIEAIEEAGR
jgi:hypothetical protein